MDIKSETPWEIVADDIDLSEGDDEGLVYLFMRQKGRKGHHYLSLSLDGTIFSIERDDQRWRHDNGNCWIRLLKDSIIVEVGDETRESLGGITSFVVRFSDEGLVPNGDIISVLESLSEYENLKVSLGGL